MPLARGQRPVPGTRCLGTEYCRCAFCIDAGVDPNAPGALATPSYRATLRAPFPAVPQPAASASSPAAPRGPRQANSSNASGSTSQNGGNSPSQRPNSTPGLTRGKLKTCRQVASVESCANHKVPSLVNFCLAELACSLPDILCARSSEAASDAGGAGEGHLRGPNPPTAGTALGTPERTHPAEDCLSGSPSAQAPVGPTHPRTTHTGVAGAIASDAQVQADVNQRVIGGGSVSSWEGAWDASEEEDVAVPFSICCTLLPTPVKQSVAALARRQGLLSDALLLNGLLDSTWRILDVSNSPVSDASLAYVASSCPQLRALDVRCCDGITGRGILGVLKGCPELKTLRMGGSSSSDAAAKFAVRRMLKDLLPQSASEESMGAQGDNEEAMGGGMRKLSKGSGDSEGTQSLGSGKLEPLPPDAPNRDRASPSHGDSGDSEGPATKDTSGLPISSGLRRRSCGDAALDATEDLPLTGRWGGVTEASQAATALGAERRETLTYRGPEVALAPEPSGGGGSCGALGQEASKIGHAVELSADSSGGRSQGGAMACTSGAEDGVQDLGCTWEDIAAEGELPAVAPSLRWVVWPEIDGRTLQEVSRRCPRIGVVMENVPDRQLTAGRLGVSADPSLPSAKWAAHGGAHMSDELLPDTPLDDVFVRAIPGLRHLEWGCPTDRLRGAHGEGVEGSSAQGGSKFQSIAERFRLAYIEREERLAPKRAKNARQRLRKDAQKWLQSDVWAKARLLSGSYHP